MVFSCRGVRAFIFVLNIDTMTVSEKSFAGVGVWKDPALVKTGLVR